MDKDVTNPSEVKYTGGIRSKGGTGEIKRFASPTEAYNDLYNDVHSKLNGGSSWVKPQTKVSEYISKFAPKEDNNDPASYASSVLKTLNTQLKKAESIETIDKNTSMSKMKNTLLSAGLDADHELTKAHLKVEDPKVLPALKIKPTVKYGENTKKVIVTSDKQEKQELKTGETLLPYKEVVAWQNKEVHPALKEIEKKIAVPDIKKATETTKVKSVPIVSSYTKPVIWQNKEVKSVVVAKSSYTEKEVGKINIPSSVPNDVAKMVSEHKGNSKWKDYKGNYFIYSKEDSKFYVLNNKHEIIDSIAGLRGQTKGDFQNTSDPGKGRLSQSKTSTTAGGAYSVKWVSNTKEDIEDYDTPFAAFHSDEYGSLGVHGIYKGNFSIRKQILNDPKVKEKLFSYGCINVPKDFLLKHPLTVGDSLFITKEPKYI